MSGAEANGESKQDNGESKEINGDKEVKYGNIEEKNCDECVDEQLDRMLKNDESGVINLDQNNDFSTHSEGGMEGFYEGFNEGLSTVIIVKKIEGGLDSTLNSTNGDNDSKSDLNTSAKGEGSEKSMSSNKTKSESGRLGYINLLSNPEDESDILCELCSEPCENYQQLVRHVRKEHRDCTFVRNYLDEIKTLSFSHCPHCRKEFVAKSSLEAHVKVTHGGQMSKSKLSPLIQKFNINKQELTYSRLFNKQYFTNKINNTFIDTPIEPETISKVSLERHERPILDQSDDSSVELNGKQKIKCDICDEDFDTRQQAIRHQNKVHRPSNNNKDTTTYKCTYCSKVYDSKERLLKHCLKTHFRSIEDMSMRRKRKGGGDNDDDEDDYSGNEMIGSDDDNDSEFDDEGGVLDDNIKMTRSRKSGKEQAKNKKLNNTNNNTPTNNNKTRSQKKLNLNNNSKQHTTSNKSYSDNSSRSVSPSLSNISGRASRGEFSCNLCGADFNRMTLLVTHARYCRQKCA